MRRAGNLVITGSCQAETKSARWVPGAIEGRPVLLDESARLKRAAGPLDAAITG